MCWGNVLAWLVHLSHNDWHEVSVCRRRAENSFLYQATLKSILAKDFAVCLKSLYWDTHTHTHAKKRMKERVKRKKETKGKLTWVIVRALTVSLLRAVLEMGLACRGVWSRTHHASCFEMNEQALCFFSLHWLAVSENPIRVGESSQRTNLFPPPTVITADVGIIEDNFSRYTRAW